jgi:hypothetical protein
MEIFETEWCLGQDPDLKEAVRNGLLASAYGHFEAYGHAGGRAPRASAFAQLPQ